MKEYENHSSEDIEQHKEDTTSPNKETPPEFSPREPHHNPIGAIIGTVILFALLILAGLYVYGNQLSSIQTSNNTSEEPSESLLSEESEQIDDSENLNAELDALEGFENREVDSESNFDAESVE
ncbi:MAG: hypothetical protein WDZ74_00355 [Candidatus Paceibacterota bacterium]